MESSLHRALKVRLGSADEARREVVVDGYRADAIDDRGTVVEIQSAPLAAIRTKVERLLESRRVRIVKPVVIAKRITRKATPRGEIVSSRKSPWRGALIDVFDDFIGIARVFPHPLLDIEVVGVEIEEIRAPKRRGARREHVLDRELLELGDIVRLRAAEDLWRLIPHAPEPGSPFTTKDLSERIDRSLFFAQRVAYCLRLAGAVEDLGKLSRFRLHARTARTEQPLGEETHHERARSVST